MSMVRTGLILQEARQKISKNLTKYCKSNWEGG